MGVDGKSSRPGGGEPVPSRAVENERMPIRQIPDRSQPLTDPMAYVRHDREQAAAQIDRKMRAWRKAADGGGETKAAAHAVSQPGESAELEADAVADRVAGELHGGAGAKEQPAAPAQAAPAIGAKLEAGAVSLARKDDKKGETPAERPKHTPLSGKAADEAAAKLGFNKTNERAHGQPVYKMGRRYITPDVDGHNGGVWKMADSTINLELRRIGD